MNLSVWKNGTKIKLVSVNTSPILIRGQFFLSEITRGERKKCVFQDVACEFSWKTSPRLPREISRQLCRLEVSLTGGVCKESSRCKETWPARASEYCFVVNSAEPVAASLIRKSGSIISIHFRRVARLISKGANSLSKTGLRSWRFNRMFQLRVARRWRRIASLLAKIITARSQSRPRWLFSQAFRWLTRIYRTTFNKSLPLAQSEEKSLSSTYLFLWFASKLILTLNFKIKLFFALYSTRREDKTFPRNHGLQETW